MKHLILLLTILMLMGCGKNEPEPEKYQFEINLVMDKADAGLYMHPYDNSQGFYSELFLGTKRENYRAKEFAPYNVEYIEISNYTVGEWTSPNTPPEDNKVTATIRYLGTGKTIGPIVLEYGTNMSFHKGELDRLKN